ncbi:MAG: hypothetical protein V7L00_31640 [Nostoc sp.]|uniref:hypothetical protein n=1 Tax=Nostoc sp. TaxID=1180 RepID=UPI002FFC4C3E
MVQPGLTATEPGLFATEPAIIGLSQDYLQSLKVKETNGFLTASPVRLRVTFTVGFQVKKLGK